MVLEALQILLYFIKKDDDESPDLRIGGNEESSARWISLSALTASDLPVIAYSSDFKNCSFYLNLSRRALVPQLAPLISFVSLVLPLRIRRENENSPKTRVSSLYLQHYDLQHFNLH